MRGIEVRRMRAAEARELGVDRWGIWEKEPSEFDWVYTDEERCWVIEGRAQVTTGGESIAIGEGDYVVFPRGLSCRWKVTERLRKHYEFF